MSRKKVRNLAYIAGFFDGEGHISIWQKTKYKSHCAMRAGIGNTNVSVLKFIVSIFPANIRQHKRSKGKPFFYINYTGEKATIFLESILPFLQVKKEQAEIAVLFEKTKKSYRLKPGQNSRDGSTYVPQNEIDFRLACKNRIARLNDFNGKYSENNVANEN